MTAIGFSKTALSTEALAMSAPMPGASAPTAVTVDAGLCVNIRKLWEGSFRHVPTVVVVRSRSPVAEFAKRWKRETRIGQSRSAITVIGVPPCSFRRSLAIARTVGPLAAEIDHCVNDANNRPGNARDRLRIRTLSV